MRAYIRLRKRQIKNRFKKLKYQQVILMIMGTVTFLSFQNCTGAKQPVSSTEESSTSSSGASTSKGSGSTTAKNPFRTNGSSYSSSSGGYSNGGSGGGYGSPVGTSSGSSSGALNGSTAGRASLSFQKNLVDATILLKQEREYNSGSATLAVVVINGAGPLRFTWFKDGRLIDPNAQNLNYFVAEANLYINANDYSAEGNYKVTVSDGKTQITSREVRVKVEENHVGCNADTYWASATDPMSGTFQVQNRFNNSKGKFLIGNSHMYSGWTYRLSNYRGFTIGAGSYLQTTTITCTAYIPNLHENINTNDHPNCNRDSESWACIQSPAKQWEGAVTIRCANNKWVMVSNTCRWFTPTEMCEKGHTEYCPTYSY